MVLISVIISTFNRWELLKRAVESVLNQTHKEFECFVIDDCSTDPEYTTEKLTDDSRVTLIRLPQNMREKYNMSNAQGMTRNEGLKLAKGKYIAFLDDDDWWEPQKLEIQLKILEENPQYKICGTNAMHHCPGSSRPYFNFPNTIITLQQMKKNNLYIHSSVIADRKLIEKVGRFDPVINEDYELWKKIFQHTNGFYLQECLTNYWDMGNGWRYKIDK